MRALHPNVKVDEDEFEALEAGEAAGDEEGFTVGKPNPDDGDNTGYLMVAGGDSGAVFSL